MHKFPETLRHLQISRAAIGACALLLTGIVSAGGFPSGNSTLPLLASRGTDLACNQGDWVHCPVAEGGLGTERYHAIFVEIPAGTGNLTLQVFDADVGAGAGEAAAGRDTGVASATQATQYLLRNPAGVTQTIRFNRGNGVSAIGGTTTGLALGGTAVSCTTPGPTTADNRWCTIFAVSNPTAGHWELRIASVNETPIHYYGVRAQDTATSRDLNVYTRSFFHYGNQSVDAGRVYNGSNAFYPYVTEGCTLRAADFDSDDTSSQSIRYRSRTGSVDRTITEASGDISGNDQWNDELITFTTNANATEYGIWLNEVNSGSGTSNHVTPWAGSEFSTASPPTTQPQGGADRGTPVVAGESYRFYFPNNSGAAPVKPFVEQRLSYVSGTNPPTAGSLSRYRVTLSVVNPTPYPITFADNGPADLVRSYIPNDVPNTGNGRRDYAYVGSSFVTNCGNAVSQPADGADNAVLTWNPGAVAATSSCTAEYQLDITPRSSSPVDTTLPATSTGATNGLRAQFLDETGTRFIFGPICALQLTVGSPVPVPVTLSHFTALREGAEGLQVRWGTDSEAGTIGFNLYSGDAAESRHILNAQLIPARAGNSVESTEYSAQLFGYDGKPLWIEEISDGGKSIVYGPYAPDQTDPLPAARAPISWTATRTSVRNERAAALRTADDEAVLIRVDTDGAYRVRYEDVAATGLNWLGSDSSKLALYLDGSVQDVAIDGGAQWRAGSALRFIGQARDNNLYSRERIYHLRRNDAQARAMSTQSFNESASSVVERYQRRVEVAPNNAWSFASPTADPWYALALTRVGSQQPSGDLSIQAPNRVPATEAWLQASLWGGLNYAAGPDHRVRVAINGEEIADERFDGVGVALIDREITEAQLSAGDNQVRFTLDDSGFETDRVHIESIALNYTSALRAEADQLTYQRDGIDQPVADRLFADGLGDAYQECLSTADCVQYLARGFSDADVLVYRGSGTAVAQLDRVISSDAGSYAVRYAADESGGERYWLSTRNAHLSAVLERARQSVDLFTTEAEYLVIAPAFMIDTLQPLLAAHRSEGLSARAIAIEDIYPQFGDGSRDPEALRRFVQAAHQELGTRYLLIAGGDTYDYFNYTGAQSVSLVPTFYRATHPSIRYGATDLPYGDLDGDGTLDIAIGRMPARTAAELSVLIEKSLRLGHSSSALPAVLVADQAGEAQDYATSSNSFEQSADALYRQARANPTRVFLESSSDMTATRDSLFAAINTGSQWVSYYGHGSPVGWTYRGLLGSNDVATGRFTNRDTPFLTTMWGCWGGFFVDPHYQGLSHALLVGSDAGAGAVIAASGLTDTDHDEAFAQLLIPEMTRSGARLGDAFRIAQSQFARAYPQALDVSVGMILLGDPALILSR